MDLTTPAKDHLLIALAMLSAGMKRAARRWVAIALEPDLPEGYVTPQELLVCLNLEKVRAIHWVEARNQLPDAVRFQVEAGRAVFALMEPDAAHAQMWWGWVHLCGTSGLRIGALLGDDGALPVCYSMDKPRTGHYVCTDIVCGRFEEYANHSMEARIVQPPLN